MPESSPALTLTRKNRKGVKGIVFNIQKYSIEDGPGIRTTVFLKGCPLRCQWCSNPESQHPYPEVVHRDSLCTQCGECVTACPTRAISLKDSGISIDRKLCTNCGECVDICNPGALKIFGKELTAGEVFQEVAKDADFYRNSGGGVTASGGEPLQQPAFVAALFWLCQDEGISTFLETTGCAPTSALEQVLPYTTAVLFDLKLSDPANHRVWTGQPNQNILQNLALIVSKGIKVIPRIPIIPGINDSDEALEGIARIVLDTLGRTAVDLIPYHIYGIGKYQMLDRQYTLPDVEVPNEAELYRVKMIVESFGLKSEIIK
jgi:pyruvate formate lyase activating enzyme